MIVHQDIGYIYITPDGMTSMSKANRHTITVAAAEDSLSVPAQAVVREGDGKDVVWLAMGKDSKGPLFTKTAVVRGKTSDGWVQIQEGLKADQLIARKNALFLSSLYETNAQ